MEFFKIVSCFILLFISTLSFAGTVNINTADADTIAHELSGIGHAKAAMVVDYRNTNGPFTAIEDIAQVKGIGQRTVELNREKMVVK